METNAQLFAQQDQLAVIFPKICLVMGEWMPNCANSCHNMGTIRKKISQQANCHYSSVTFPSKYLYTNILRQGIYLCLLKCAGSIGNDGNECPVVCPQMGCDLSQDMNCYGGMDANGCQLEGTCQSNTGG